MNRNRSPVYQYIVHVYQGRIQDFRLGGVKLGVQGPPGPLMGPGQSPGQGSRGPEAPGSSCVLAISKWFRYVSRTPSMISILRVNNFMTDNYNIKGTFCLKDNISFIRFLTTDPATTFYGGTLWRTSR